MYCNSCGMNSLDAEVCEWCKNPIGANKAAAKPTTASVAQPQPVAAQPLAAQPVATPLTAPPAALDLTQPIPPGLDVTQAVPHGGNVRMSLTGEIMEVEAPVHRTPPGTFTPPGTAYAPPPPVVQGHAAVRDLPPGAIHPRMMDNSRYEEVTLGEKWEKCLAMLLPIMLLGVAGVHFVPTAYLWIELGTLFLSALVMGATQAIGSYDEAFAECTGVLVISYFFGPLVGFGGYLVLGLIRQEMSAAINFLLLFHALTRFMFIVSAGTIQGVTMYGPEGDWSMLLPHLNIFSAPGFISFFVICSTFAGWMISSFFRPVNE